MDATVVIFAAGQALAAKQLGDPVPDEVKQERVARLMELQRLISEERNEGLVGSTAKVLIDRKEGSYGVGRTEWDAPEIDQEVYVEDDGSLEIGNFCMAEIVDAVEYDLFAKITTTVPVMMRRG